MNIKDTIQKLYRRITGSGFLKSVLTLSSGVVVGQAINLIGMPVVGRLYSPAAMGDYTLITSNVAVISAVACLGMMSSFMLPEEDEEARGLSRLVTYSTLLISTLVILVLWLCSGFYQIFRTEETPYVVSLLVLGVYIAFNTINNICYAYVNRQKLYRVMFWNPIIGAGTNICISIVLGLLGWDFIGYTAAHILSFGVQIVHLVRYANPFAQISSTEYRCTPLLKRYRRFPLFQMPANLLSSLSQQLPVQTLGGLFSSDVLGLYSMALKIISLPTVLLATPINRVYYQEASQRYNRGDDIGDFTFKILEANIKIAIIPICILMVFGEWIFAAFLGKQWWEAGTYAAIMGMYQLMLFCSGCISGGFVLIRRNELSLISTGISLVLNLLACIGAVYFVSDPIVAVALISGAGFLANFITNGIFFKLCGMPTHIYLRLILSYMVFPAAVAGFIRFIIL